jgi:pyruvate/2-oxoglutarate/acetoin dehydrogenase E1 component
MKSMKYLKSVNSALRRILESDNRVILLGEDIVDPYGGAFKVTRGLSTDYPERVRSTPVSEAAIIGVSAGLALSGLRPIVEIMFGDFTTLGFDQIINHISKFQSMYANQTSCPVIIRTPMGAGRSYGPTHSQSLEKHFLGIPDFVVAAGSVLHDPYDCFKHLVTGDIPALFVEHKVLYVQEMRLPINGLVGYLQVDSYGSGLGIPTRCVRPVERKYCKFTIIAYGYIAGLILNVVEKLAIEHEIFVELIAVGQISPIDWEPLVRSGSETGRIIVCEEGTAGWNWGSGIAAELYSRLFGKLHIPIQCFSSAPSVIPAAPDLEKKMLFNIESLVAAILKT